jgi:hypothetical protein
MTVLARASSNLPSSQSSQLTRLKASRAVRQSNMVMSPMGLGTKNRCAGEGQQQFSSQSVESVLSCIVSSRYLATAGEQTEDFICAVVVVIYIVCKLVRPL